MEIIHQEQIKLKKITIITLLLITALAVHGCGNKKNVSDNETVKETASLVIQQETVRLSTQETTTEQITESETALKRQRHLRVLRLQIIRRFLMRQHHRQ